MAFRDFRYPDVIPHFGLTWATAADLFAAAVPVAPAPAFREVLDAVGRLATTLNTEKGRSEWLIAPLLGDFWWRYRGAIGLYSGLEFVADPGAGLTGFCDFLISRAPQQPNITAPAVVVFEAKRENINDGLGQCIAGMVGAQRFNLRHGTRADPVHGCVTTGSVWRFLALSGTTVTFDLVEYTSHQADKLLGILTHMVGPVPAPAAA